MVKRLIMFYGEECPHCHDMEPLVERLEEGENLKIVKLEVWHNSENKKLMEKYDKDCGGVPFFFNEKNGKSICGAVSFEVLKKWALS